MLKSVQQLLEILDLRSRIHFALLLIPMVGVTIMDVISIIKKGKITAMLPISPL